MKLGRVIGTVVASCRYEGLEGVKLLVLSMYIGKVIGSVVATVKISHLEGRTLLLVDQLDLGGKETGAYDIAVDTVHRRSARHLGGHREVPHEERAREARRERSHACRHDRVEARHHRALSFIPSTPGARGRWQSIPLPRPTPRA